MATVTSRQRTFDYKDELGFWSKIRFNPHKDKKIESRREGENTVTIYEHKLHNKKTCIYKETFIPKSFNHRFYSLIEVT